MSKVTQSIHFTDSMIIHQLGKESIIIKYNAYVDPATINEDVVRTSLIERSRNNKANAMVHHHKYSERCGDSVKPCEKYNGGNPVEEF